MNVMRFTILEQLSSGLSVFDEHNSEGSYEAIHGALRYFRPHETPVFRVVDEMTRRASLQVVKAGLVLFNLRARRIVQVQNTYSEIERSGRVQATGSLPSPVRVFSYRLPPNWTLVP